MNDQPKVSIAMITFNHERFIMHALESALAQQADFPFEIVIGEDASTDRTRELLMAMAQRFPDRVRLILHPTNVGMHENLKQVLARCRGDYVALLEGDDYWTDSQKLRLQAELLDGRPDVAICHHNALTVDDDGRMPSFVWHARSPADRTTIDSLLEGNMIVTCTAMFRNRLFDIFPVWYGSGCVGDWTLHVLNARHGKIAYVDRVMAVYRMHSGGVWSPRPRRKVIEGTIATGELMFDILTPKQRWRLKRTIARWKGDIVELLLADQKTQEAVDYGRRNLGVGACARLVHHFHGWNDEQAGRRLSAAAHYLRATGSGWGRTRIGAFDLALALMRVACPAAYRIARSLWRRTAPRGVALASFLVGGGRSKCSRGSERGV